MKKYVGWLPYVIDEFEYFTEVTDDDINSDVKEILNSISYESIEELCALYSFYIPSFDGYTDENYIIRYAHGGHTYIFADNLEFLKFMGSTEIYEIQKKYELKSLD